MKRIVWLLALLAAAVIVLASRTANLKYDWESIVFGPPARIVVVPQGGMIWPVIVEGKRTRHMLLKRKDKFYFYELRFDEERGEWAWERYRVVKTLPKKKAPEG